MEHFFPISEELAFIDFEYGAFNYEAFEIGNHFDEYAGEWLLYDAVHPG